MELELNFTDITLSETDGIFKEVQEKMLSENPNDRWMIRSNLTITSQFGVGEMVLDFHGDGKIMIIDYNSTMKDVYYNPDIQALSVWSQENGWKIPQASVDLIRSDREFWKHFYDVMIIDSDYFDNQYGKRPQLEEEK